MYFSLLCSFVAVYKIYGFLTLILIPVIIFGIFLSANLLPFNENISSILYLVIWVLIVYFEIN